ncbi:MAG: tRNA glutamyl-Q(34) synthetase GluQRS [Oscillospiraceae bacterium]|nr:tRNA glutamyl-Q(34) synthetase GluQRS [Oscillospiraceae bacterium]
MKKNTGRYAPSPSGVMHVGNISSSLLAWLDCKSLEGSLIFRIEDLDRDRCKSEYARKIADDLQWLGIPWDEGWSEDRPEYAQSSRTMLYDEAFCFLQRKNLVYPCYCSRSRRLSAASAPHPGEQTSDNSCRCRYLSLTERSALENAGKRPAWKLKVPDKVISFNDLHYGKISENLSDGGDFIIRRSDGLYAYQLAVSVDDMTMGITRVVRGRDLLNSTPKQIWLISELGGTPPEYCHAPLLVSEDRRKMSKRYGDLSMEALRERLEPEEIVGRLAGILGITESSSPITAEELVERFSWDKIPEDDIIFKDSEWL